MSINDNGGHEIGLTPPQPAPAAEPAPVQVEPVRRSASGAGRTIGILVAVVGGIALVGAGTTAAFAAGGQLSRGDSTMTADVSGIRGLDLDVAASQVTVEFANVDEAELRVEGGRSWVMERDEDELVVRSPDRGFGWWFGGWFGDDERVQLTLPSELRGLDADIDLGAGSLEASGEFGDLDVVVGAGALTLDGSATSVDAEINAGRADIELDGVDEADLTVSAGRLVAELTGTTPREVTFQVSAGSMDLTLPDDAYAVTQNVDAGSFDNRLKTDPTSPNTVQGVVEAGSATLRSGD